MIKFATENDRKRIIDLWMQSFGDKRQSVEQFLQYFPCNKVLGYYVDGEIASFMFLLEVDICFRDKKYRANYIYALCTSPEFRSRGYAASLVEFSKKYSAEKGVAYTLIRPASPSLFSYYLEMGFEREYRRIKKNLTIDGDLLYNNLNAHMSDVAFVQWGSDGLGYSSAIEIDDGRYSPCLDDEKGERYLMLRRNIAEAELFDDVYMGLTFE